MNDPLVSVLMTSYNAEPFIGKAIQSVIDQTYSNWELLILDDVSKDETRSVIDSFDDSRIRKIYNIENIGYVASKNILLQEVRGDYACFLDADDWLHKDRIQVQLAQFIKFPQLGACMCNYFRVHPDGSITPMTFFKESQFINILNEDIEFAGAGIMFKKDVVETIGGFETYFDKLIGDDNYWTFKIAERFPFYFLNEPLYYYRANPSSLTASILNPRKLSIIHLLQELKRQRKENKTDWLEQRDYAKALSFEDKYLTNKKWVAEFYRLNAAIRLDYNDSASAKDLLKKSFQKDPFNKKWYKTYIYLLKAKLLK